MSKESVYEYFEQLKNKLSEKKVIPRSLADIQNFPLTSGQCLYLIDYSSNKIIWQAGVEKLLGYTELEFDVNTLIDIVHPHDEDVLMRLIRGTLEFATENDVSRDLSFFLTYRVRHKTGRYLKIMRISNVFEIEQSGHIISNLSVLSDVSFLNLPDTVQWSFDAPGLDHKKFATYITRAYSDFFTDRETEIILALREGLTSREIAQKLFISKHTVDTHRRKILSKTGCESTIDVINFCNRNGVV